MNVYYKEMLYMHKINTDSWFQENDWTCRNDVYEICAKIIIIVYKKALNTINCKNWVIQANKQHRLVVWHKEGQRDGDTERFDCC